MRTWLSPAGTISAVLVGASVWIGTGWRGFVLLAAFLVTSSLLTPGGGGRRPAQVFANGGVAAACALLALWRPEFTTAFAGAVAAAAADTWSTEIGGRSATPPVLITSFRPVAAGVSGGVSLLGSAGALGGAALMGVVAALTGLLSMDTAAWVATGGIVGALADSLLGASVQSRWRCERCGAVIETPHHECGGRGVHLSGIVWLNNDLVNLAATLTGAAVPLLHQWLSRSPAA